MIKSKQIEKLLSAYVRVSNFAGAGTDDVVTTAITTALGTAGEGGVSVPVQVASSSQVGLVTSGANNRVEVYANATKAKLKDGSGNEVYGRLTEAAGVYTLSYYTLVNGTETAYNLAATAIDFEFVYRFDFARYPAEGAIGVQARNVYDDPAGAGATLYSERLTVTAQNTIANLTKTPSTTDNVELIINEASYSTFGGGSANFSVAGKAITWSAANSGFNVETTDFVVARYTTTE